MEEFWQNVVDFSKLIVKVLLIMWLVDVVAMFFGLKFRVPYLSKLTDFILAKIIVLS